jgi:hypothetical protein
MLYKYVFIIVLTILAVLRTVQSKVSFGTAILTGEHTEHFLSKFSIGIGSGSLEAKFWVENIYENPRELSLHIYCDEDWRSVQTATTCRDKIQYSRRSEKLVFQHHEQDDVENAKGHPAKIAQVFSVEVNLTMHIRTHYWYFMLADCTLEEYYHEVPKIYYNVVVYNEPGNNHLPADETGMSILYLSNTIFSVCGLILSVYAISKEARETGSLHLISIMLLLAILLSISSTVFEIFHLSKYTDDGIGSNFSDTMAAVTGSMFDFVVTFLLLSVSCGWTLTASLPMNLSSLGFTNKTRAAKGLFYLINLQLRKPSKLMSNFNLASSVLVILFLFHLALVICGRSYGDEFDTFHDFEHFPGKVLMLFRIACGVFFLFASTKTIKLQGGVGDMASFLLKFRIMGMLWFLSLPFGVFFAPLFAEYLRHWWITAITMILQCFAIGSLLYLLAGHGISLYDRRSILGTEGLLPECRNRKMLNPSRISTMPMSIADGYGNTVEDGVLNKTGSKIKTTSIIQGLRSTVKAIKKARIHID